MLRSLIAAYVLDIPSIQELVRTLHRDLFLATQCGIQAETGIPTRFAYYRFIKKLIAHMELIEECMGKTIECFRERRPGFGKELAADSTDVPTYANRYRKPCADPDAEWGVKTKPDGEKDQWLGYKMHLVVDAMYGVPFLPIVTPANMHDSPVMIPLLEKNRSLMKTCSSRFVIGDKGYDGTENYRAIVEDFHAIPIIPLNLRRIKGKPDRFEDLADEHGTPYCAWGVPMVFWGFDRKQKRLKYRCPQACGRDGCTWADKCSKSRYGLVVKIRLKDDYRRFIQVPRHTKKFRKLADRRGAIERVFSGLKKDDEGRLVNHRIRGLNKITLNCLLSVWVLQARKLAAVKSKTARS